MTTPEVLVAVALAALAAGIALHRPATSDRLARAVPRPPPEAAGDRTCGPRFACALAGLALALTVGAPAGLVVGVALGALGPRLLERLEPEQVRRDAAALARDLPLALDLLAACLAGGAPLPAAVGAVAAALPGPCGRRFGQVAVGLAVGCPPAEAWAVLGTGDLVGASAARALARAGEGGAPVAAALSRVAADARRATEARSTQAARRAGVLAVGPLGLCFLPAFVLLGVVPAVIGLAAPLLASR